MAEIKTKPTDQNPEDFLHTIEPEWKREDSFVLLRLYEKVTGEKAVMWGPSIVGFGKYHVKSKKSTQGADWPRAGFSPRKQSLTLYVMDGNSDSEELFKKLGRHTTSKACLYLKRLSDVDLNILEKLIAKSYKQALTL